ncbi:hypothetical protein GCM10011367_03740 [Marinicauda pacifica]|jgi:membrane associated rhomboid family serine protease|nr:rhomboid family intramembrane serine protease [Marinicauda pacifica]GGE32528.1 hypothetical protein GCM10011367_03740 [Marinicauda pacifica]
MQEPAPRAPIFNQLPAVVVGLSAAIVAAHALGALFVPFHQIQMWLGALVTGRPPAGFPGQPLNGIPALVLHVFVHGGWTHLLMNLFILLAAGNVAARPFGRGVMAGAGFLAFFFLCAAVGGAFHLLLSGPEFGLMIGASTGVSGLIAAAGWATGGRTGMLRLALPWLVINIAMGLFGLFYSLPISWAGHIGGLVAGAVFYPLFVRWFRRG